MRHVQRMLGAYTAATFVMKLTWAGVGKGQTALARQPVGGLRGRPEFGPVWSVGVCVAVGGCGVRTKVWRKALEWWWCVWSAGGDGAIAWRTGVGVFFDEGGGGWKGRGEGRGKRGCMGVTPMRRWRWGRWATTVTAPPHTGHMCLRSFLSPTLVLRTTDPSLGLPCVHLPASRRAACVCASRLSATWYRGHGEQRKPPRSCHIDHRSGIICVEFCVRSRTCNDGTVTATTRYERGGGDGAGW
jgi:hypothetical protein